MEAIKEQIVAQAKRVLKSRPVSQETQDKVCQELVKLFSDLTGRAYEAEALLSVSSTRRGNCC